MYGQFAIFIFAAWAGTANGGVIAGLAISGVVVAAVSQAAVLMQVLLPCTPAPLRHSLPASQRTLAPPLPPRLCAAAITCAPRSHRRLSSLVVQPACSVCWSAAKPRGGTYSFCGSSSLQVVTLSMT